MPQTLFTPGRERCATTNAWAFLHALSPATPEPPSWARLRQAIAADPAGLAARFATFAAIPATPARLRLPPGGAPALVLHRDGAPPRSYARSALIRPAPDLPPPLAAALSGPWAPARLLPLRAALLLHADLRPDDVVLLAGLPAAGWLPALSDGTRLVLADPVPGRLLALAAETGATVLAAPAGRIAAAAFPRRDRAGLARLRTVVAVGGPMAPEARARVFAWVKADLMLLAAAGARLWGDPLSPVLARPRAEPALFGAAAGLKPI
jgi:hypothetical protein